MSTTHLAAVAITWSTKAADVIMLDTWNPLEGVTPSLDVFGATFKSKTNRVLAGVWALVLVILAARVLLALAQWGSARRHGHDPDAITEGAGALKKALLAFGIAVAATAILGAVIALFQ